MSSIEERLSADIAAVTQGVVVTESDLRDARDAIDERIDSQRHRDRRRVVVAAAAAAVLIPALGFAALQTLGSDDKTAPPPANPAPTTSADPEGDFLTGSAPTPELIQGVWRVDEGTLLLKFTADGAIQFDDGGLLYSNPSAIGTYEIAGDLITVTVDGGPAGCAGQTFAMRASLPGPGAMRFVHTQPGTGNCAPRELPLPSELQVEDAPGPHVWWVLEQVLPTSQGFAEFAAAGGGYRPLSDKRVLYGDWMAEGGGHVLEIAPDGTYYVADESGEPIDRGQWTLQASDLTLTSSAASAECTEGDRLVLGGVEQVNLNTPNLRGTVEQNTCGGAWTPSAWWLIPHAGS